MSGKGALENIGPEIDLITAFPPDVMYDWLEGVVPFVITTVIQGMVTAKTVTLTQVNNEIQEFNRNHGGSTSLNNFTNAIAIKHLSDRKLTGTAAQKWYLIWYLPAILASLVPRGNKVWGLLLKCREISEILMADIIPRDKIPYLSVLIAEHHQRLKKIAGNAFTPKCHYIIHYPLFIELYGAPRRYWTARFEAVHQYFKSVARECRNWINVPHTLAWRFQFKLASALASTTFLSDNIDLEIGSSKQTPLYSLPTSLINNLKIEANLGLFEDYEVTSEAAWISSCGDKAAVGNVICTLTIPPENISVYLQITHIICIRSAWFICGFDVIPEEFDEHRWSHICTINKNLHSVVRLEAVSRIKPVCAIKMDQSSKWQIVPNPDIA